MVKLTIKRADNSPDNNKWVCKRVEGVPELKPPEKMARGTSDSLPANEEAEDPESWRQTIPSYLEVEMKEIDDGQRFWRNSDENNANVLQTQHPTYSSGTTAGSSCNDPMDLSGCYPKQKPQRDVTNVSNKSPTGAYSSGSRVPENFYSDFRNTPSLTGPNNVVHCSKSKGLENVDGGSRNTPSLTGREGIIQDETASHLPRVVWSQNTSTSPNQRSLNFGEVVAMSRRTMPDTIQNLPMNMRKNSPYTSGFVHSEKPEVIAKSDIPNHLHQGTPTSLKTNHGHFSADTRGYGYSSNTPISHASKYNWPWTSENNASSLPIRGEFAERMEGISGTKLEQNNPPNYLKRPSQTTPVGYNDSLESVHSPKRKKSHTQVPGILECDVCNLTFKSDRTYDRHLSSEKHLKKVNQAQNVGKQPKVQEQSNLCNTQPNSVSRPIGPTVLETPLPLPHHLLHAMANQMQYQQMWQAFAMAVANQSADGKTINNAYVPNFHPGTSKSDCSEEFMGQNRFRNDSGAKIYVQDPRHMKLPVNHTSSPQGGFLQPRYPLSENSKFVNPKYLENKAPESARCHEGPARIQSGNLSVSMSEPCVKKPKSAQPMASANQNADGKTIINNAYVPNSHPGTSKSDCNEEQSLGQNRFRNGLETTYYTQDPRHMKPPVNHTSNNFWILRHPQSHNSNFTNPKYLENQVLESSCNEDPSRIQPGNFSVSMPEPCVEKPNSNQPENLIAAGPLKNSEGVRPVSYKQSEFFRVYACLVCSAFFTDDLPELERHVFTDRTKTPVDMISAIGGGIWCKLCDFKTESSVEMCHHVASLIHKKRADYYNHVMEGDHCAKQKLEKVHQFSPVLLFCAACEFHTTSLDNLKIHSIDPSHHHNASCCMYISKFSSEIKYCFCRPCKVKTPTKRELLLHLRSGSHMHILRLYPSNKGMFHDPAQLFYIKELTLKEKAARVSEQTEGSIFIEEENLYLRKENNETNDFTENPAPLDLSSKPLPVSCSLCQQVLPDVNVLAQHFQRIHGVNEEGVKWLISNIKVHKEKSLPTEKLSDTEAVKPKSIVSSPHRSSATDKSLPVQGMDIEFPLFQSSVAAGQNLESKPSTCPKIVASDQTMAMVENLNEEKGTHSDSSSSHRLSKIECMQNPERSCKDSSVSQAFYGEDMRKKRESDQNLNFNEEIENIDPLSSQQFHTTKDIPSAEAPNSEENLNSSSSQAEVIVEYASDTNADGKSETLTDESFSEGYSAIEGLLALQSSPNAKRKRNDSSSSNPLLKQQFCKTENVLPLGEERVPNSGGNLNSSSPQAEVIVEYESEPNGMENETETKHFTATEHGSPPSASYHKASRERNDISSRDHNSATSEPLPAVEDSSNAHASPTYKRLPAVNDSSVAHSYLTCESSVSPASPTYDSTVVPASPTYKSSVAPASPSSDIFVTPERLLTLYDSLNGQTTPISQSVRNGSRKLYDSSLSDHSSVSHESPPVTHDSFNDEHGPPISQSNLNTSRKVYDSSSSDPSSISDESSPITHDSFHHDHGSPISQSDLNTSRKVYDSSLSDCTSVTHPRSPLTVDSASENFLATGHESPKTQSGYNTKKTKKNSSSSSDDILIEFEWLPSRAERNAVNSPLRQHNLLDSENKSPLKEEQNLNLGQDVVNDSSISTLTSLVESKQEADNISIMNTDSGNSMNGLIVLNDCPNEYEALTAPNSPVASDLQIQAWKDIENIEITEVFSLKEGAESSSNTEEEEESFHFENVLPDPENL